jgi:PGF-CTERM protein
MAGIGIKTADQDDISADNPLRFYIYKSATIEGAAAPAVETVAANVTAEAAPAAEAAVEAAPAAAEAVAAEENKTVEAPAAEAHAAENKTAEAAPAAEEKKEQPGFEGVFALTGLLAVAYLVLGRRE